MRCGDEVFDLHHVGVVLRRNDHRLLTLLLTLSGDMRTPDQLSADAYARVEEFEVDCYLYGQVEVVIPYGSSPLLRWFEESVTHLHHFAVRVDDVDATCEALRAAGYTLATEQPVTGICGLRVNFVHPKHTGVLVEIVG